MTVQEFIFTFPSRNPRIHTLVQGMVGSEVILPTNISKILQDLEKNKKAIISTTTTHLPIPVYLLLDTWEEYCMKQTKHI